jgi:hypothetical protein
MMQTMALPQSLLRDSERASRIHGFYLAYWIPLPGVVAVYAMAVIRLLSLRIFYFGAAGMRNLAECDTRFFSTSNIIH